MSQEMLEAFRILEEEKHINKDDIIDAVKESLKSAYKRRYGETLKSSLFVKLLKKFLTAALRSA